MLNYFRIKFLIIKERIIMKETNCKIRLMIGSVTLILAGVLVSCILLRYQKDWIMLVEIIAFIIIFLKCFRYENFEKYVYNKLSKHLNVLSIILITIALTLLPDSAVAMMNEKYQGMLYFLSFLCWFMGLYFLSIKSEYKNRIENK